MSNQRIRKSLPIKKIIAELRAAATTYRSTRKRTAIHDFLEVVYGHYWAIKKSPKLKICKSKLKSKAKLSAEKKVPLSRLILRVASADFDRRDLHRWNPCWRLPTPTRFIPTSSRKNSLATMESM